MREKPKVSIIITTYNRADLLKERSLPSALNSTYPDFEVIVVDDHPTEEAEAVVKEFQKKHRNLRYVNYEKNKGLGAARNTGAKNAEGEYVVFLDDDDALTPEFLETMVPLLDSLPKDYGGVGCGRIVIYPDSKPAYHVPPKEAPFNLSIDDGFLLKKEVFSKISYDEGMFMDEDSDFGIQFMQHYKMYILDKPLLLKYGHAAAANSSFSFPSERRLEGLKRYFERKLPVFIAHSDKKELAYLYRTTGRNYSWGGRIREGIPLLRKAFFARPTLRNLLNFLAALAGQRVYRTYWFLEVKLVRFLRAYFLNRLPKHSPTLTSRRAKSRG